jgi:hypothetical protein
MSPIAIDVVGVRAAEVDEARLDVCRIVAAAVVVGVVVVAIARSDRQIDARPAAVPSYMNRAILGDLARLSI